MKSRVVQRKTIRSAVAGGALRTLGADAKPAIPGLTKLLYRTNMFISTHAAIVLAGLGTNGLPALMNAAADPRCPYRSVPIASIGFAKLGTNTAPAIPILIRCSQDADPAIASEAMRALRSLSTQPGAEIPAPVLAPPPPRGARTRPPKRMICCGAHHVAAGVSHPGFCLGTNAVSRCIPRPLVPKKLSLCETAPPLQADAASA